MHENKMEEILKEKFTENPIVNYLKYWSICHITSATLKNDKWRRKYDLDVNWLDGDFNADTIFSYWIPLKMVLDYLNPNEKFYKKDKYSENPNSFLEKIINNIEYYLPRNNELVQKLYILAELSSTKANVMRLPDRKMQVRGLKYYDQMPKTLYECFEGGDFYKFFNYNEKNVVDWIENEKLKMFFDSEIAKKNIKPLIKGMKPSEVKWLYKEEELLQMLNYFIEILIKREKLLKI